MLNAKSGNALLGLLTMISASVIISLSISRLASRGLGGQKSIELRSDLEIIRAIIREQIDCDGTIISSGINVLNPTGLCNSTSTTQTGPYFRIRRQTAGTNLFFSGTPLSADGSFMLGEWNFRLSCSEIEKSLILRAARTKGNGFLKDPLTGKVQNWTFAQGLVFGASANGLPLCANNFNSTLPSPSPGSLRTSFTTNIGIYDAIGFSKTISPIPGPSYEYTNPAVAFAELTQIPVLPVIPITKNGYLGISAAVNANYNGFNACSSDLQSVINYQFVVDISRDGGEYFTEWNAGTAGSLSRSIFNYGTSLMNGGGDVTLHGAFPVYKGDNVILRAKIRYQRSPAYNCVTDWGAWGGMTVRIE